MPTLLSLEILRLFVGNRQPFQESVAWILSAILYICAGENIPQGRKTFGTKLGISYLKAIRVLFIQVTAAMSFHPSRVVHTRIGDGHFYINSP